MATDDLQVRVAQLAQENDRLRRSVQELSLLNNLAREIGASHDSAQIISRIVRRASKLVAAEQGAIRLLQAQDEEALEPAADLMKTLFRVGYDSAGHDTFRLNTVLLEWMKRQKAPLLINEPAQDPRFPRMVWDDAIRNLLCVPLLIRSRLTGILTVYNNTRTPAAFTQEDQRLLSIVAMQSAQILENARLYEEEKKLLRMREELRLAKEIQTAQLPQEWPSVADYLMAGTCIPAQTVGGDYLDWMMLEDGTFGICLGDASGKGLPAALYMANVQAALRAQALVTDSAAQCITRVNQLLCARKRKGSFMTLFYGVFDPQNHRLTYCNAGHNRPLLVSADGTVRRVKEGNLVLGITTRIPYMDHHFDFKPGDSLVIYSDGITEAMNPEREQFEEERLSQLLRHLRGHGPDGLVNDIVRAVRAHSGTEPQTDDMTLVVIKRVR